MGKLQDQLDQIHKDFESGAPRAALDIMHRATDDLANSGMVERAAGAGDSFPDFERIDASGNAMNSSEVFGNGPVIVNFFRGFW
ncbi:MAG: hypothetical protein AAGA96_18140 [Verrucomicrobiota bacterium]